MGRRIAVVGAGVSGLIAAAELHRAGHEVTVLEAGSHAGGHTHTHSVALDDGSQWRVDTGFIVMNDRNYPNFTRILAELGVATQATNMSFGVSDGKGEFEWSARGLRGLFARPRHLADPRFLRMLAEIARFNRRARVLAGAGGRGPSLRDFLAANRFSDYFIERLLVPQAASIWSADPEQMWSFPAAFLAEFFDNHGTLQFVRRPQWRTVVGGSRSYVEALTRPFAERVHLDTPVRVDRRERGRHGDERARQRALRRRRDRDPLRSGAADARRPERARARDPRRDPLPPERDRPPHRRCADATPPRRLGELELPPARRRPADDADLRHEPPAAPRRAGAVPRHPEPDRRDRSGEGDQDDLLLPPRLHQRRHPRPGALARDQRHRPHPLLRRVLALGLPRGRLLVGAARLRGARRPRPRARRRRAGGGRQLARPTRCRLDPDAGTLSGPPIPEPA